MHLKKTCKCRFLNWKGIRKYTADDCPMETCQLSSLRSRHCRSWRRLKRKIQCTLKKEKKNPISATPITICVQLLNALQAELHALCIVMRRGGECHHGTVLTSEEEGKFQSQTNALFACPLHTRYQPIDSGNTLASHIHAEFSPSNTAESQNGQRKVT